MEDTGRDALNAAFADLTAATRAAAAALGRGAAPPLNRDAFLYDERFNETENLAAWRASFVEADTLPPLLGALLLARAWRITEPVQRQAWLAPLLAVEFGGADRGRDLRHLGRTDGASEADDPGEEYLVGHLPRACLAQMLPK